MHPVHTPYCAATGLSNLQGRVVGNAHSLDRPSATRIATGVLFVLYALGKLFPKAANKHTHYTDTALAFSFGFKETGPNGVLGGVEYAKSSTVIPLSDTYSIIRKESPKEISISLMNGKTVLFSRHLTQDGFTQVKEPLFDPSDWDAIDKGLATFMAPYHDLDMKATRAAFAHTLGISPETFRQ